MKYCNCLKEKRKKINDTIIDKKKKKLDDGMKGKKIEKIVCDYQS